MGEEAIALDRSEGRRRGRPATGVRDSVVVAAQAILTESGVARLSTKEVAKRAGVAESSIFYHFGDRIGLLFTVIQQHLRPVKEVLFDLDGGADLRADLVAIVEALEEFFVGAIPVLAAIQSDVELRAKYQELSQTSDHGPHRAVEAVTAHLTAAVPGTPDPARLRSAALLLVGAAHQRALQRYYSPPEAVAALPAPATVVDTLLPSLDAG